MSPIATYLDELAALLRRRGRGRILAEVRAHLIEAAALGSEEHAVERFGPPARVAAQFNAVTHRPRALLQRAFAVMLASAGMATVGTATVWALEPSSAHQAAAAQHHRAGSAHHRAARWVERP
ncbi:MAG TPA: hypothetical protein VHX66_06730 [Solirubrobacteraceae bacterium]|jgi:hypothetical protein|nr:hypothetical protein [Solirubrobacteraceae bacterium]